MEQERVEATKIRCKDDWIDKKENCSRYFFEEEKRKGKLKTIECLLNNNGEVATSKEEICETAIGFYKDLLTAESLDEGKLQKLID